MSEQPEKISLAVKGMTCASCVSRVEKSLLKTEGVIKAEVNLATEKADITYQAPATVSSLAAAIEKTGYQVGFSETNLAIEGMTCASCVSRVEKALLKVPGVVSAEVNLASEKAKVRAASHVTPEALAAAVAKTGYKAKLIVDEKSADSAAAERKIAGRKELLYLIGAWIIAVPFLIQMVANTGLIPPYWQLGMATVAQFWFGWRFYRAGTKSLMHGGANMDVLVALGTSAAYGLSLFVLFLTPQRGPLYFDTSATLVALILLGRYLESNAKRATLGAIAALSALKPTTARLIKEDGSEETIQVSELKQGDKIRVAPTQNIAADGVIIWGESSVNESQITGESLPVVKAVGDAVTGGTLNQEGMLVVEVTRTGAESSLSRMIRLIEDAQAGKAPIQRLVDKIAGVFVPVVLVIAALTFIGWLLIGVGSTAAIITAVAVLVVACPCALGLATPTAIMAGTGVAAKQGILVKDAEALERAHKVNFVLFDKTGTLTEGKPVLAFYRAVPGEDPEQMLALCGALQSGSEHPLAGAVQEAVKSKNLTLPVLEESQILPGRGVSAKIDGRSFLVGSARLMQEHGIDLSSLKKNAEERGNFGESLSWLAEIPEATASLKSGRLLGLFTFADRPREVAKQAVATLQKIGVEVAMLSGDHQAAAESIGRELGIRHIFANVTPEGKAEKVKELVTAGKFVAMVGDGVNDAPALAAATVGFAMGSGTDVAMQAAGVTLMRSDPRLVADAITVSGLTDKKIKQGLAWALLYNGICIPLAVFAVLNPVLAGALMAGSSVLVVVNALTLMRFKGTALERVKEKAFAAKALKTAA